MIYEIPDGWTPQFIWNDGGDGKQIMVSKAFGPGIEPEDKDKWMVMIVDMDVGCGDIEQKDISDIIDFRGHLFSNYVSAIQAVMKMLEKNND